MPETPQAAQPAPSTTASRQQARRKVAQLATIGLVLAGSIAACHGREQTGPTQAQPAQNRKTDSSPAGQTRKKDAIRYAGQPAAEQLAREIAQRRGWDPQWVQHWIGQSRQLPGVIRLVTPVPAAARNWATYRARLVEPARIEAGRHFWQAQRTALERAEASHGVPAWLIVGIIGIETYYGRHTGSYRVLDALATLSLDFPAVHPRAAARQSYFRGELETLLQLSQEQGVAPDSWRGSYAGAMGLPQFMPGSWLKYAIDFDGDGRIDLRTSTADAIGSVANYLRQHGWQSGMPTHYPVRLEASDQDLATLLAPDIKPSFDADRFQALGARLDAPQHAGPLALIELRNGDPRQGGAAPSFVAGTENFYVVTRYNWSSQYAMAVIELGQAVQAALEPDGR